MTLNKPLTYALTAGAVAAFTVFMIWASHTEAKAADLGGNCCADLEERIAELEATAARKGNRKVTLTIYGQVNAGLLRVDAFDFERTDVTQNGTDETFVGFAGAARVSQDVTAGYVLELDIHDLGLLGSPVNSTQPAVRQSYWYLKSDTLGKIAVGKQAVATGDFDKINTANTTAVYKPLSLGAVSDAYVTGIDLPFDGQYRDTVRYDSPVYAGFLVSASWGNSFDITEPDGNGDTYDVALRYANEFSGFRVAGGVGYRHSTDLEINILNLISLQLPTGDVDTFLATGSVMHMDTGLFVTVNYGDQDYKDAGFTLKDYDIQAGLERRYFSIGKTTVYGTYGQLSVEDFDVNSWSVGVVQAIDSAAMDLYASYKNYDLGDLGGGENEVDDAQIISAGARIKF